jgi:PAS domain S-box-containing protein
MALIATGLLGVYRIVHLDSLEAWVGRGTQYIGGAYLLVAALIAMRGSRRWIIPLETLRETHGRYMSLVEFSPDAILVHAEGRYIFANPAAARLFGAASPTALVGRDVLGLVHPEHRDSVAQRIRETAQDLRAAPLAEVKVLRLDGEPVDVEAVEVRVEYEGRPAIQVVLRDVTDRKRAKETLRESEERLHLTLEAGSMGTFEIDLTTGQARWNATEFALLGLQPGDAPPGVETFFRFVHPDDLEALQAQWAEATRTGTFEAEFRLVRADGQERWLAGRGRFLATADGSSSGGQPGRFLGVNFDITERKQAEESLRTSEARLRLATEAARMFTWECDVPAQTIRWSENAAEVIGCRPEELPEEMAGSHFFVAPEDSPRLRREFDGILGRSQSTYTLEFRGRETGETTRYWLAQGRVLHGTDGNPLRIFGVTQDITGRKQVEETLRVSERRYSSLFANKINGVAHCRVITGEHGRPVDYWVLEVNEAYEQIIGIMKADIEGRRITEVFPDIRNYTFDYIGAYGKVALEGGEIQFEAYFEATQQYLSIYAYSPLPGEFAAIFTDITERKRIEEALRISEERLRFALESCQIGAWDIDLVDHTAFRSPEHDRIFGYPELLPSWTLDDFLKHALPEHRAPVEAMVREATVARTGWTYECPIRRADGEVRWIWFSGQYRTDSAGRSRVAGVVQDVTERKQAEQALRESEEKYRRLVGLLPAAVYTCDADGTITFYNERAAELWGRAPKIGDTDERFCGAFRLFGGDGSPLAHCQTPMATAIAEDRPFRNEEVTIERPDGSRISVSVNIDPLRDGDGRVVGAINAFIDITGRKQAEQALQELNETLEKRVTERTAVAEVRAEQLRMLAQELTQAEQRERQRIAHILHEHFQQLLVGAKFNLSMVQPKDAASGESLQRTDQVLAEAVEASRSLAVELSPPILRYGGLAPALGWLGQWMREKHNLTVEVVAEPQVPMPAEDVQILLFQAVRELLFNVVKHAGTDLAKVELKRQDGQLLQLSVSDNGAGFQTERLIAKASTPGGFGLFSIRERLSFLDGQVEIQSAPGAGTCISLLVPLSPAAPAGPASAMNAGSSATASAEKQDGAAGPPTAPGAKVRVLIADDHAVVRDGLSRLLQTLPDMEVVGRASDGREAVDLTLQLRPDVVIMDVSMPEMSGIEATRCILADLPATRIIGLSMHKDQDVADQMRQAGAVDYLAKSGPTDGLVAAIRQHAAKEARRRQE